ncbi:SEC12-like protein 2 [Wolffia australiana]
MSRREIPPCSKTYGFPIYCSSWAPLEKIYSKTASASTTGEDESKNLENQPDDTNELSEEISSVESSEHDEIPRDELFLVLGGGGGEGRSGVPNVILIASYDLVSQSLSETPVQRVGTEEKLPYRMAVHPEGEGILFAFPNGCRFFEWESAAEPNKQFQPKIKSTERMLPQLEDIGLQLALAFDAQGSLLATGGEDGKMRIYNWPSMELSFEQSETGKSVKDLNFCCGAKFLASVLDNGNCRVWDLNSKEIAANLPRENREKHLLCRFSQPSDGVSVLYTLSAQDQFLRIIAWSTASWDKIASKNISKDPVSAFNVSPDGKFLAIGTIEGDVVILSQNLQVHSTVKRAHIGLVTTLAFSHDSRALVSTSFDSFSRVTMVEKQKRAGNYQWIISVLIILLAIILALLAYYIKEGGIMLTDKKEL